MSGVLDFKNKIPVAMEFYKAARSELVERVKLRDQVLTAYLAFVGVIFGALFLKDLGKEVGLVIPFLGLGCAILVCQHNAVIGALIRYTNRDLQPVISSEIGRIPEFVSSRSFKTHSSFSNALRSFGHAVIVLVPEICGLAMNYQHALSSPFPTGPAWWFGFLCVALSAGIIQHTHSVRRAIYDETPWDKDT